MRLLTAALFGIAVSAATLAAAAPGSVEMNTLFNEACDLYEDSDFEGALRIFESLVSSGVRHPAVYYNLGNCYYQLGEMGRAVANYRRAEILSPRDEDIRANLAFLRSSIGFQDTTDAFDLNEVVRLPGEIASPREWKALFYMAYYSGILCFLGILFLRTQVRRKAMTLLAVLIVLAASSWAIARQGVSNFNSSTDGVLIVDHSEFMSGPGAAFDELARLPDGVEVETRARSGIWVEVKLPTGEIGWVREENLEAI